MDKVLESTWTVDELILFAVYSQSIYFNHRTVMWLSTQVNLDFHFTWFTASTTASSLEALSVCVSEELSPAFSETPTEQRTEAAWQ